MVAGRAGHQNSVLHGERPHLEHNHVFLFGTAAVQDQAQIIAILKQQGITVVSLGEPLTDDSAMGQLVRNMVGFEEMLKQAEAQALDLVGAWEKGNVNQR